MADEHTHSETGGWFGWLDRETLLDITVNAIPMGILAFFIVFFTVFQPWEFELTHFVLMHFLTAFPLLLLIVLTYVSAKLISRDEGRTETG